MSQFPNLDQVSEYAESHFDNFVEKLKTLIRVPSISFDGFPPEELRKSAQAVAGLLKEDGLENVEILELPGAHPYIYGDWLHAPGKPTLLLYAHHDVQPPGREEVWETAPFEPIERKGRLFGRGSADDKAGIIIHSSAISSYLRTVKRLPINVKMIVEGEEEIGSGHLEEFLEKYRDKLAGDVIVLTDTGNFDTGIPTITTSLRGLVSVEIEVSALKQPVHSGMWGGPCPDPVLALSRMLAKLVDEEGRIAIPGIYDEVTPLTKVERDSVASLKYTDEEYRKQAGLVGSTRILGGPESPLIKMTRLPSIAVNAIQASTRKGVSNVVNGSVWCKIGLRTVPNMDGEQTLKLLIDFLKAQTPWGVEVTFSKQAVGGWWRTVPEGIAFDKAKKALSQAFGRDCVFLGSGGSIPFVDPFAKVLGGAPALLVGVEDPYTNAHSENESLDLADFRKSILGAIYLYEAFGE